MLLVPPCALIVPLMYSIKLIPPFRDAVPYHLQVNHELENATSQRGQRTGGHKHEILK